MKMLPWIAAAAGVAAAAYVLTNLPGPQYATGSDDVEGAARKTSAWGSKNRIGAQGRGFVGKLKETAGAVTGNQDLADEGTVDRIGGAVQDAAGQLAQAAGETLHEFNR